MGQSELSVGTQVLHQMVSTLRDDKAKGIFTALQSTFEQMQEFSTLAKNVHESTPDFRQQEEQIALKSEEIAAKIRANPGKQFCLPLRRNAPQCHYVVFEKNEVDECFYVHEVNVGPNQARGIYDKQGHSSFAEKGRLGQSLKLDDAALEKTIFAFARFAVRNSEYDKSEYEKLWLADNPDSKIVHIASHAALRGDLFAKNSNKGLWASQMALTRMLTYKMLLRENAHGTREELHNLVMLSGNYVRFIELCSRLGALTELHDHCVKICADPTSNPAEVRNCLLTLRESTGNTEFFLRKYGHRLKTAFPIDAIAFVDSLANLVGACNDALEQPAHYLIIHQAETRNAFPEIINPPQSDVQAGIQQLFHTPGEDAAVPHTEINRPELESLKGDPAKIIEVMESFSFDSTNAPHYDHCGIFYAKDLAALLPLADHPFWGNGTPEEQKRCVVVLSNFLNKLSEHMGPSLSQVIDGSGGCRSSYHEKFIVDYDNPELPWHIVAPFAAEITNLQLITFHLLTMPGGLSGVTDSSLSKYWLDCSAFSLFTANQTCASMSKADRDRQLSVLNFYNSHKQQSMPLSFNFAAISPTYDCKHMRGYGFHGGYYHTPRMIRLQQFTAECPVYQKINQSHVCFNENFKEQLFEQRKWAYIFGSDCNTGRIDGSSLPSEYVWLAHIRDVLVYPHVGYSFNAYYPEELPSVKLQRACIPSDQFSRMWDCYDRHNQHNTYNDENHISAMDKRKIGGYDILIHDGDGNPPRKEFRLDGFFDRRDVPHVEHSLFSEIGKALSVPGVKVYSIFDVINSHLNLLSHYCDGHVDFCEGHENRHRKGMLLALLDNVLFARSYAANRPESIPPGEDTSHKFSMDGQFFSERPFDSRFTSNLRDEIKQNPQRLFGVLQDTHKFIQRLYMDMRPFQRPDVRAICYMEHLIHKCQEIHMEVHGASFDARGDSAFPSLEQRLKIFDDVEEKFGRFMKRDELAIMSLARAEGAIEKMGFLTDSSKFESVDPDDLANFYIDVFAFRAMPLRGIPCSCHRIVFQTVPELGAHLHKFPDTKRRVEQLVLEKLCRRMGRAAIPDASWVEFNNFRVFLSGHEVQPVSALTSSKDYQRLFGSENREFMHRGEETFFAHPVHGMARLSRKKGLGQVVSVNSGNPDQWWQYASKKSLRRLRLPAFLCSEAYTVWTNSDGQLQVRDRKNPEIIHFQSEGSGNGWRAKCMHGPHEGLFLAIGYKPADVTWISDFEAAENCAFFVDADNKLQKVWVPRYNLCFELRGDKWMQFGTDYQLVDAPLVHTEHGGDQKLNPLGGYKGAFFLHNTKQPGSYKIVMPPIGIQARGGAVQILSLDKSSANVPTTCAIKPSIDKPFISTASPVEVHFFQRRTELRATRLDGLSNDGNFQLGVIFFAQGKYDRAAEYFKKLYAGDQLSPANHSLLIDCIMQGRFADTYSGKTAAIHLLLLEKWMGMYGLDRDDIAGFRPTDGILKFEDTPLGKLFETYLANLQSIPLQLRMDPNQELRLLQHLKSIGVLNLEMSRSVSLRWLSLNHFLRREIIPEDQRQIAERLRHYDPMLSLEKIRAESSEGHETALPALRDDIQRLPMEEEFFAAGSPMGDLLVAYQNLTLPSSNIPILPLPDPAVYLRQLDEDDKSAIGRTFQESLHALNDEIRSGTTQLELSRNLCNAFAQISFTCNTAIEHIEGIRSRMRNTTRDLHKQLLALVNKPNPIQGNQDVVICATPVKLKEIIAAYGRFATRIPPDIAGLYHFLRRYNTSIVMDDMRTIVECAHSYMKHKIMFRRMANVLQIIRDLHQSHGPLRLANQSKLCAWLSEWGDVYDPEVYPHALLAEYVSGKQPRHEQIETLVKLCGGLPEENPSDIIIQMQMGAGKTSVIIPTLAAQVARGGKLPFICSHNRSQFDALCAELAPSFSRLNMRVVPINFTLRETQNLQNLRWLLQEIQTALLERDRVFIINPTTIEILEAQFKLLARKSPRDETDEFCFQSLLQIFAHLRKDGLLIGDEIDRILNPLEYLNVSIPPTDGQPQEMSQDHLNFVSNAIAGLGEICPEFLQNQQHLMDVDRKRCVLRQLTEHILKENSIDEISEEMHEPFVKYVLGEYDNISPDDIGLRAEADEFLKILHRQMALHTAEADCFVDHMAIFRGLLKTLLPHLLTQKYNQNYGFSPDGACIPFKGPNEPNLGSEFKNCFQTACCFFAGISIDGLPRRMLDGYVNALLRLVADEESQRKAFDEFNDIFKGCICEGQPVSIERLGTTEDLFAREKILARMHEFLMQEDQVINRQKIACYLAQKSIHFSTTSVESKSAQFPQLFGQVIGFSGTVANRSIYNFNRRVDIRLQDGSAGQVIARNFEIMNDHPIHFVDNGDMRPTAKMLLDSYADQHPNVSNMRALIDAGALLNGQHPREVAIDVLNFVEKHIPEVRYVLYYDPDTQTFFVRDRDRREPIEIRPMNRATLAAVVNDFNALFVYFDEQRCTGTDLPLAMDCQAIQTIDLSWLATDRNAQANLRLRAFLSSQAIDYVTLKKSQPHFLCEEATSLAPTAADLYATLGRNQARSVAQQKIHAAYDKLDAFFWNWILDKAIILRNESPEKCQVFTQAISELLVKRDDFSPRAMFLQLERAIPLGNALEACCNSKIELLKSKLAEVGMSSLCENIAEEAKKHIIRDTDGIFVTVGENFARARAVDTAVQVEVSQQTTIEVNCNISINQQLEELFNKIGFDDRLDPKEEEPLVIEGPTDMHIFLAKKSRSIREQIKHHGGPMDARDLETYSKLAGCFSPKLFLSHNSAQSCKTERSVLDPSQKNLNYMVIIWNKDRSDVCAIAVTKAEYNALRANEDNLQNCCIYLAGNGSCLHGQLPESLEDFRRQRLCELALFNGNISYLLAEDSNLVARTMAANDQGVHDPEKLKLAQSYLLLRTDSQDRDEVRAIINHSRPIGLGHGKSWPKDANDIPVGDEHPDAQRMKTVKTWEITHPRWAIALTIISALSLTAAALAITITNVIGILAIGIWGYLVVFSPGAVLSIVSIILWIKCLEATSDSTIYTSTTRRH
jgi:hypothetical protein